MKSLIHKITGVLGKFTLFLTTFGPIGLFAIAFLDSVMVPLPGGVDAVLMLLSASRPAAPLSERIAWMLLYAGTATVGSTLGCYVLYRISRRAGHRALARFSESKQKRVKDLIDRYDVLAVLVASLLPPPFPFKLFVVSAGVFELPPLRFVIAIGAGRAFRYVLLGYLAARYGDLAKELLARYYPAIGIGLAVVIVVSYVGKNLLRRAKAVEEPVPDVES